MRASVAGGMDWARASAGVMARKTAQMRLGIVSYHIPGDLDSMNRCLDGTYRKFLSGSGVSLRFLAGGLFRIAFRAFRLPFHAATKFQTHYILDAFHSPILNDPSHIKI